MDNTDFLLSKFSYIFSQPMQALLKNDGELIASTQENKISELDPQLVELDKSKLTNE